jgi:hypothetical protein
MDALLQYQLTIFFASNLIAAENVAKLGYPAIWRVVAQARHGIVSIDPLECFDELGLVRSGLENLQDSTFIKLAGDGSDNFGS